MNEITKYIPDEAAVSDQLAEMDEEDRSIIRWALLNNADELRDYCCIDGKKTNYFRVNYLLRGVKVAAGNHKIDWKFEPNSYLTGDRKSVV